MANSFSILLLVALLCVSAARTKPQSIGNVDGGICKSLVETQGYPCQEHKVTTEDDYILGLQRIPAGKSAGNETAAKLPVLLHHGILMDASAWLLNSPDKALAFILADNGFDVWLANSRGTVSSRGHKTLTPLYPAYWDWSWDQLAAYDLPALFAYVNNQTGQKLHYVGHSLGTLTPLAAFSQGKLVNMLRSAALLAPIAYLGQMRSPFARTAVDAFLAQGPAFFFSFEFPNRQVQQILQYICARPGSGCSNYLTATTVFVIYPSNLKFVIGPNCCLGSSSINLFLRHTPQSTSIKNAMHLFQMVTKGNIAMYDYVFPAINIQHYNQPTPPVYNMENIPKDVPLFLSYGGRDPLSNVLDVKYLLDNLRDHDKDKLVAQYTAEYAHMDFLMAENANQVVYAPLLDFFKLH
nr:triacylglycerol lipase 2-like [Malus domestica]